MIKINFRIFIFLSIASFKGQVKIVNFKDLDVMIDNELVDRLTDGTYWYINEFQMDNYGDYYSITTKGKIALFEYRKHLITRAMAFIALVISLVSLVVSLTN